MKFLSLRSKLTGSVSIPVRISNEREPICGGRGHSIVLGSLGSQIAPDGKFLPTQVNLIGEVVQQGFHLLLETQNTARNICKVGVVALEMGA